MKPGPGGPEISPGVSVYFSFIGLDSFKNESKTRKLNIVLSISQLQVNLDALFETR